MQVLRTNLIVLCMRRYLYLLYLIRMINRLWLIKLLLISKRLIKDLVKLFKMKRKALKQNYMFKVSIINVKSLLGKP
jgi:hypothetical protein